ncbi:hypothetical protein O3M35_012652 [Rhynocoris fuscipes]|uniref:Uncharacterized protein n=1 Tax=Rhynocoris fuscipes TaxID=488301 RepID=A0AAW1CWY7_9HEMI
MTIVVIVDDYSANNARIDEKLVETAKLLRHDLSRLKLLGNVAHIVFVRDKRQLELNFVYQLINSVESSQSNDQPYAQTEGNLTENANKCFWS